MFECLLQRHGSAVACHRDRGSGCCRPGWHSVSCQSSWRRLPLAPPYIHVADEPQTGEQLYQISSHSVRKFLGPTAVFPTWGSSKGIENPQGIWLWRPVGFDYRTSTGLGKQTLGGHKQTCGYQDPGERSSEPTWDWARLAFVQESSVEAWVDSGLPQGRGTEYNSDGISPFEGGCHYHTPTIAWP